MPIYNGSECNGLCQRKLNPWRQHRCKSLASAQSTRFTCQAHPCHIHSPCHRQKECFDFLYKIPYTTYVAPVHYAYVGRSEGLNELQNHCPPQRVHRREKMAYPRRGKCIHIWGPMHPYPCEDPCIHIHTVPVHPYPYEDPCAHIHMMAHAIYAPIYDDPCTHIHMDPYPCIWELHTPARWTAACRLHNTLAYRS